MRRVLRALVCSGLVSVLFPLAARAGNAPLCGDVNDSSSINTSDALAVLRKGVGQDVILKCSAYDNAIETCQAELETCQGGGEPRFEKTPDGTIVDHATGLEWEAKDGNDDNSDLTDPHDVDNKYKWSLEADGGPNGPVFTDFLGKLNEGWSDDGESTTGCYAGHCDWRLPTVEELSTIAEKDCASPPCVIDDLFLPAPADAVYSDTRVSYDPNGIWSVDFSNGAPGNYQKGLTQFVRAVRGKSSVAKLDCGQGAKRAYGHCWYLGAPGDSCTQTCAANERSYDVATRDLAGSSGSDVLCQRLLESFGYLSTYGPAPGVSGSGCQHLTVANQSMRITTPATTADASGGFDALRMCACQP